MTEDEDELAAMGLPLDRRASDERELAEMGLMPPPRETVVPAEANAPIAGGALAVRLPPTWAPHSEVHLDDGTLVFVEVGRRGRTYEPGRGRRVARVADRASTAVVRRA